MTGKNVLYIVRGLPGSGKSTLASKLVCPECHIEADKFHVVDGEYKFDLNKMKEAHEWCFESVYALLKIGYDVAVSNTFTRKWEYEKYMDAAQSLGVSVQVIDCHGEWENIHNVPEDTIKMMEERWEPYIK